ncbi:S1C family serine protease [Kineococcus esterisolvens]|uniref:S1C family serine protease n=1 Tax=unclassified Kineococcus TaxID=2621656 RepID=UPI003D7D33D7
MKRLAAPCLLVVATTACTGLAVDNGTSTAEQRSAQASEEPATDVHGVAFSDEELVSRFGHSVFRVDTEGCDYTSTGTAFVIDSRHLVTNHHVVENDASPVLVGRDGRQQAGRVIGWRTSPDVAVIEVTEELDVDALEWADPSELAEGQHLLGLGYPLPEHSFSAVPGAIVSFESNNGQRSAIRTDGAFDKGNSGGPVLTPAGSVAGVATLIDMNPQGLQIVPMAYTAATLRAHVQAIIENPQSVDVDCTDTIEAEGPSGSESDPFRQACAENDDFACDSLYWRSPAGSEPEYFAMTCGGRSAALRRGTCSSRNIQPDFETALNVLSEPEGLRCADLMAHGYSFSDATRYWAYHGRPGRMDVDSNGIPCETVYAPSQSSETGETASNYSSGLFCRDLISQGASYSDAVQYWLAEGQPSRMDADSNGIPCEEGYSAPELEAYWGHP